MKHERWPGVLAALLVAFSGPASAQTQASAFFDDTVIQEISLNLDPADWASLQEHYLDDTYYHADFVWDGNVVPIGIKSRGTGSRSPVKPNLTLKFSKYTKSQTFLGMDSVSLKANNQDASNLREWLAMKLFRRVGLPAPREAPARLYINGRYQGFYTIVEIIDETFLRRNFGESGGYLYQWNAPATYNFENLGEAPSLYAPFLELKTSQPSADLDNFTHLVQVINGPAVGDDFIAALSKYLDPKLFLTYAAIEGVIDDRDGIVNGIEGMNNFYLYQFEGQSLYQLIAWDKDLTFLHGGREILEGIDTGKNINVLMRRLAAIPEYKAFYLGALERAASLFGGSGEWGDRELARQYALIHAAALDDPNKQCTEGGVMFACGGAEFESAVQIMLGFLGFRSDFVQLEARNAGLLAPAAGEPGISSVALAGPNGTSRFSPGALVTISGANLGGVMQAPGLPLPRILGSTFVAVEGIRAPLVSASEGQIGIQAPWDLAMGTASFVVSVSGAMSNTLDVAVGSVTPAIFGVLHAGGATVNRANPVTAGETVSIYMTGLGAVSANLDCGAAAGSSVVRTMVTPEVYLQRTPMDVKFSGLAPGFAGLYQVNATAPETLPQSGSAMLSVTGGGETASMMVALP